MTDIVVLDAYERTGLHLVVDHHGLHYVISKDQSCKSLLNIAIITKTLYGNTLYIMNYKEYKWLTSDYVNMLVKPPSTSRVYSI